LFLRQRWGAGISRFDKACLRLYDKKINIEVSFTLYESPVMSVLEGTGFHPFVVPALRDGGYVITINPRKRG
jgi:hypothetical protein